MDYLKLYNRLCISRKFFDRIKSKDIYYESHHIQPVSLGGDNSKENKVLLTPKEHFVAHLLLYKHFKKEGGTPFRKMAFALVSMTSKTKKLKRDNSHTSRAYAYSREAAMLARLGKKIVNTTNYKKPLSETHKQNVRLARLKAPPRSAETVEKLRIIAYERCKRNMGCFDNHLKVTCTYCGKEGQKNAMLRWHFENCKFKKEIKWQAGAK